MLWAILIVAALVAIVLYKLVVKPLFKIGVVIALAVIVWLLLTNS